MVKKKVLIATRTLAWNRHIDYFWDIADDYEYDTETESINMMLGLSDISPKDAIVLYLETYND